MAPTLTPDRQTFRQTVAQVAERAKAILPAAVNGRVEKAVALVLQGDVEPQADGTVVVFSATDATRRYVLQGTACTCADFERGQAPEGWCAHRIAAGIAKRVGEVLPRAPQGEPKPAPTPQALPEAPASANCHIILEGRQVQVTLRDTDEGRLLQRLAALLKQYPVPAQPERPQGWCAIHHVQMKQTTKNGRSWWSHRTAEGWCKGR